VETVILDPENKDPESPGNVDKAFTPSALEYDPTIPARYMVGTEEGKIICCSKKAKNQPEVIINKFRGHYGPIRSLQRNPTFSKNFLSIGDWSARVWADDVLDSSLLYINSGTELLTDGCWSITRPCVFYLSRTDGWLEAWDIIYKQTAPSVMKQISNGPIHCISVHNQGSHMCVGKDDGGVSMIQISESLSSITREEKASLNGLFDRETRREKALELLDREARLRAKNKKNIKCIPRLIRSLGMQRFTQMGREPTHAEIENKKRLEKAEEDFFNSLKTDRENRIREGKLLHYSDDM